MVTHGLGNNFPTAWRLLAAVLLMAASAWAQALTATVDRHQIALNETLTLRVRYEGQVMGEPDFSDLEHFFDILSSQRQSQFALGGGRTESYTEWVLRLLPKKKGTLVVPSFRFKGEVSDAIEVEVVDPPSADAAERELFVESEVDKNKARVGEQVLVTYRIHTAVMLNNLAMADLETDRAEVFKIAENQFQKTLDGRLYSVVEVKYALFPNESGELVVPSLRIRAVVPDRRTGGGSLFGRGGKQVFLNTERQTVEVSAPPGNFPGQEWLPAKGVSLSQRWSRPLDQLSVGEPVTRTLTVTGQGITGAQLPPLDWQAGDDFKVYPDQPEIKNQTQENGLLGTRTESVAIVPTKAGTLTLPPVTVTWWDTAAEQVRTTTLSAQTLTVKPAPTTAGPTAPPRVSEDGNQPPAPSVPSGWLPWLVGLNVFLLLLVAILAVALWRQRRTPAVAGASEPHDRRPASAESKAFEQVRRRVDGPLAQFRAAVLNWAECQWPSPRDEATTLERIGVLTGDQELRHQFRILDSALYAGGQERPDLKAIVAALERARRRARAGADRPESGLKPLYPG